MDLLTLLEQKREAILDKWFDLIISTYPSDANKFLANQKDRFQNPVGYAISAGTKMIYAQVLSGFDAGKLTKALDGIIRIRSVQEFKPSEAIFFVFQLKSAIRETLLGRGSGTDNVRLAESMAPQLAEIDSKIDEIAMVAFDKYTECREQLHEIRLNEIKKRTGLLLDRINARPGESLNKGEPIDDV
jgi:hypothetical protein